MDFKGIHEDWLGHWDFSLDQLNTGGRGQWLINSWVLYTYKKQSKRPTIEELGSDGSFVVN